jgi:DNA-binding response OmpR family regulator
MYKIFIVEDDKSIAESMKQHLTQWDYDVYCVTDFKTVKEDFIRDDPHLVLMDIKLPFFNGYHWCEEIRAISAVPIIFISSASDNMNIVMAMNMGGDDFIAKPFSLEVLTAKVQAIIRRTYSMQGQMNIIEHKGAVLDMANTALTYSGEKIDLTRNDFRIMQLLMENKGSVVTREKIMEKLWESESFIDDNTLTVNITRLRRKLESAGLCHFITTKKGIGYMVE